MEFVKENMPIPDGIIEIWQRIVDSVAIFLSVPGVMINRMEPPDLEVFLSNRSSASPFPSGTRMQMDGLYCTDVALRRQKLQVNDACLDDYWSDTPSAKAGIMAYLGVPLFWPDGEVFGTLCAVDTDKKEWGDTAANLLQTLKDAIESHLVLVISKKDLDAKKSELELALNKVLTLHGFSPVSPRKE